MSERKMTAREARFVEEYVAHPVAVEAARRAGYQGTDRGLRVTAARLLAKPSIAQAIAAALAKRRERFEITEQDTGRMLRFLEAAAYDPATPWRERICAAGHFLRYTLPPPARTMRLEHSGAALQLELLAELEARRPAAASVVTAETIAQAAAHAASNGRPPP